MARNGNKHGKHWMTLVYKTLLKEEYPPNEYTISIEPKKRVFSDLYYIPDILITSGDKLVLWVEVGRVDFHKATKVIEFVGDRHFFHIPFYHPIFQLDTNDDELNLTGVFDVGKIHTNNLPNDIRKIEAKRILAELDRHGGNKTLTAKSLSLTERQLRYRIEKYGL